MEQILKHNPGSTLGTQPKKVLVNFIYLGEFGVL